MGGPATPRPLDARQRWMALLVLCLGVLMIVLDTTIVNVALPSIRADLGFTEPLLVWVVSAHMLTLGGFLLLGGRLGGVVGRCLGRRRRRDRRRFHAHARACTNRPAGDSE